MGSGEKDALTKKDGKRSAPWSVTEDKSGPSTKLVKNKNWDEEDNNKLEPGSFQLARPNVATDFVDKFTECWKNDKAMKKEGCNLINDPFKCAILQGLVSNKKAISGLVEEMTKVEWTRKQMDLYEFHQTTDLANVQSGLLSEFFQFLNEDVKSWMQRLTGLKFAKISASCSMYNAGDHLLTHDDLLTDRLIAFVYYLSPWASAEEWSEEMGGALDLFSTNKDNLPEYPVSKKIFPKNNQFVFFKVSKKSFHQVAEVNSFDYPRLTINGWFHGYTDNKDFDEGQIKFLNSAPIYHEPGSSHLELEQFISDEYLKPKIKHSIQQQIEENSETALAEFLAPNFFDAIMNKLESTDLKWIQKSPANQHHYEFLDLESLKKDSPVQEFLDLCKSRVFFELLKDYTELELIEVNCELQRFSGGNYTLIGDPSSFDFCSLDLVMHFGENERAGIITYLNPEAEKADDESDTEKADDESEIEEEDSVLLTIYPQKNVLNLVYRSEGTTKFTKYCYKSSPNSKEFTYVLTCSYKE